MEFLFIGVILPFFFLQISACYECLPRSAVQKFVSLCPLCSSQKLQHNQAAEAHHSFRIHEQRPSEYYFHVLQNKIKGAVLICISLRST